MNSMVVVVRGSQYVLGNNGEAYGIWPAGGENSRPMQFFPNSEAGLAHAWHQFAKLEPAVDPNDVAQLREAARTAVMRSFPNSKASQESAASMSTQPHKATGAPKPRKRRHLGYVNEPDPDAMTLGDWQRFRGYDPKTHSYVAQRRQQEDSGVGGMGEARRPKDHQRQAAPGRDTAGG
jgi:hypothetical protein